MDWPKCSQGLLSASEKLFPGKIKLFAGVTKHRNGMEQNGIYRNKPEYTGTRRNDAGMNKNGTGMYRNEPE